MKKLFVLLVLFLPCISFAEDAINTVSPEYATIAKNCCAIKKIDKEKFAIGEMKSSSEEFRKELFKKKRVQLFADDYHSCKLSANSKCPRIDIVGKPGKLYLFEYQQPF